MKRIPSDVISAQPFNSIVLNCGQLICLSAESDTMQFCRSSVWVPACTSWNTSHTPKRRHCILYTAYYPHKCSCQRGHLTWLMSELVTVPEDILMRNILSLTAAGNNLISSYFSDRWATLKAHLCTEKHLYHSQTWNGC